MVLSAEPLGHGSPTSAVGGATHAVDEPTKLTAVVAQPSLWPAVEFSNPAEVAGTRQKILLKSTATDAFGNPAVAAPSPIDVANDSVLVDLFDFGVMEPKGFIGGPNLYVECDESTVFALFFWLPRAFVPNAEHSGEGGSTRFRL